MYIDFGLYKKLVSTLEPADFSRAEFQSFSYKISVLFTVVRSVIYYGKPLPHLQKQPHRGRDRWCACVRGDGANTSRDRPT